MGMQIPGWAATLLQDLGYMWPQSDEEKLFGKGYDWLGFAGTMSQPLGDADGHATRAFTENKGAGVEVAQAAWHAGDAPHTNLLDGTTGGTIIGAGLMVCGGIVLALKINVIVQLTQLAVLIAQAIASSPFTMGASLAEIPLVKEITGRLVNLCISLALNAVLGG